MLYCTYPKFEVRMGDISRSDGIWALGVAGADRSICLAKTEPTSGPRLAIWGPSCFCGMV